jgi:3-hydroxyacyl-CoA dehydrogenase/enoyl-CoA hydratase/3-hydroxybutyryl-CoA epimerase
MPLLEVVRADKTAPWAVATAVALGKRQGKTVIVVRDGPGFYTTRVLAPLLNEAIQLVSDGVPADAIDAALVEWGFATGPIERLDEVGIDVSSQVAQALHAAFGARMTPPGALATLLADDRCGRKNGRGIYRYGPEPRSAKRVVDPAVYSVLGVHPRTKLPTDEIQLRCALALVNEAVRCFGDGILRDPRDGDVGAIYGLGFPAFRGGPFRYVDTIGAADVLRRVQGYADRFGERWRPAPLLVQMAKKGERFFA